MLILGIDPGPEEYGWCLLRADSLTDPRAVEFGSHKPNLQTGLIWNGDVPDQVVIEEFITYRPADANCRETIMLAGVVRFGFRSFFGLKPEQVQLMPRLQAKMELCGTHRVKDSGVRLRLKELLGIDRATGWNSHTQAAAAVALAWWYKNGTTT